jgi:predicted esterase
MAREALIAAAALALLLGSSADELRVSLRTTAAAYLANIARISVIAGRDTTYDYYERLINDEQSLDDPTPAEGYSSAAWSATVRNVASLDVSLAAQLLNGASSSMASIRGLGESLVRSSADGTMQPVAIYVPQSYSPDHAAPLVVLLHGWEQPETTLMAPPYIGQLADQTGTIVVAPWGRGYFDFRGSATTDVYDALQAATHAFNVNPRKQFLAGYSMGGFSVFRVAPVHPDDWAAMMCIAGALLGSDSSGIAAMHRTPVYLLTGSADESVPTQYPTATAAFLHAAGFDVSFYSAPGGTHRLVTLVPILAQAWSDMLNRVVHPPAGFGNASLPTTMPADSLKP